MSFIQATYCPNCFCHALVGILEVLHCILIESPEALNLIAEGHIKSIISLLDKHGRNHKVGLGKGMLVAVIDYLTFVLQH